MDAILDMLNHGVTQKKLAPIYADFVREYLSSEDKEKYYLEIKIVNDAIVSRWSVAGLRNIKRMAWKIING